jgi:hypothetical protein
MINKVYLSGGLGNQLFQIGYSLHLSNTSQTPTQVSRKLVDSRNDFTDLVESEKLVYLVEKKAARLEKSLIHRGLWPNTVLEHERKPKFAGRGNKMLRHYGYFQDPKYFFSDDSELISALVRLRKLKEDQFLSDQIFVRKGFNGLHIRGGDYLKPGSIYKQLNSEYYTPSAAKLDKNLQTIIFTNDKRYALDVARESQINSFQILDEADLSSLDTLLLMSLADTLITANSTFSWWAGFLATLGGRRVIGPGEWFNDTQLNVRNKLVIPDWLTK